MPIYFNRTAALLLALSPFMRPAACAELPANAYPQRPVRVIVSVPPGSGIDTVTRAIGAKLAEFWGRSVVVDNRPGAGGAIAMDLMARSPADGYTLLSASVGLLSTAKALKKISYEPLDAIEPVVQVTSQPYVVMAAPAAPFNSIQELLALARAKPGSLNYASSGAGSASHLGTELFKAMAKINVVHVPYKGVALALNDLIAGRVQLMFPTPGSVTQHVKTGRLRALAVTSARRAAMAPDVPTFAESGVPGYESIAWYGLVGPGKLPAAMAQRMNEDINKVLAMPDVQEKLDQYGAEDGGGTQQRFVDFIKSEQAKWAKVIKDAKVSADA